MKLSVVIVFTILMLSVLSSSTVVSGYDNYSTDNLSNTSTALDQTTDQFKNITSIELSIASDTIEYGNRVNITYGILNNESQYVINQTYGLYLIRGLVPKVNETVLLQESTTLLLNTTTTGFEERYELDTLPVNFAPLDPDYYKIFLSTSDNGTLFNNTVSFEVVPHEGAKIDLALIELPQNTEITGPLDLSANENMDIQIVLTNVGVGNAVDVDMTVGIKDGPLEYSGGPGFNDYVIKPAHQVFFNFTIKWQDYGLSEIVVNLVYNNTLDIRVQIPFSLIIHSIPQIIGYIRPKGDIVLGKFTTFTAEIYNGDEVQLMGKVKLSSSGFSFSPIETEIEQMDARANYFDFTGLALKNGTQRISLIFTYYDPNRGNTYSFELYNSPQTVYDPSLVSEADSGFNLAPLVTALVLLYVILFLIPVILYFRKDLRSIVINFITGGSKADIDYNNTKVVVDGSNVAWEELSSSGKPRIENIKKAIQKLSEFGFKEIIVVADAALRYQIEDPSALDDEVAKSRIKVLPAKVDGDSFILRLARDMSALILTNDLYKEYRKKYDWIDERRIPYSILSGVIYLHPLFDVDIDSEIEEDEEV